MSVAPPLARIAVGVVVERRKAQSPWVDFIWKPITVLAGVPDASPWSKLSEAGDGVSFYAGAAEIELHRTETGNYRDNLGSGAPMLWVALRRTGVEPPYEIFAVTADPAEGESLTESGSDVVEVYATGSNGALRAGPQVLRGTSIAEGHGHWVQWSPEGSRLYIVDLGHDEWYEGRDAVNDQLKAVIAQRSTSEWLTLFAEHDVWAAPLLSLADAVRHPQVAANGYLLESPTPQGPVRVCANPVQFGGEPPVVRRGAQDAGAQTEEVLLEIGCSWEEIGRWKEAGVIA